MSSPFNGHCGLDELPSVMCLTERTDVEEVLLSRLGRPDEGFVDRLEP